MAARRAPLPPRYEHWLDQEVNYLITDEERADFLALPTDQDRNSFMEGFWKIRNPDPNSPDNTLKQEHYRRLAFANANFGVHSDADGWRTDRGMVYITLGAPQQRRVYLHTRYLEPMEIWFYQDPANALAPYFSVIFFKPSPAEDFRLYSPYQDGPEKLIASTNAVNDNPAAIRIITQDLDPEIANLTLSLLPNETVDSKAATPTLESDALLQSKIRNYRNLPENVGLLAQRKSLVEGVTHRVLLGDEFGDLSVLATRDAPDQASVHYLFRFLNPGNLTLGKDADSRVYYSFSVAAQLLDPDGKLIYKDTQDLRDYLAPAQVDQLQQRELGVAGRLAAAPGKYQLRVEITNLVSKQTFAQTRGVLVPAFDHALGMSQVIFSEVMPPSTVSSTQPFTFSGIRIPAAGADNVSLYAGDPVRVIYQLWEKPDSPAALKGRPLEVSYLIGQLGVTDRQEQKQTVDRGSFNSQGNLLMGRDLPTTGLHPGNYRLVVRATDPESKESTSQAINFRLAGGERHTIWSITSPSYTDSTANSTVNLYRRGLCALAQHQPQAAVEYLKESAATGGKPDRATYDALAQAYRMTGNDGAAVATEKERDRVLAAQNASASKN